jgi:hypothetical protein
LSIFRHLEELRARSTQHGQRPFRFEIAIRAMAILNDSGTTGSGS